MDNQITAGVGSLLTAGSIFKIWLIEFAVCEFLVMLFLALRLYFPKTFSISLNGDVIATSGNPGGDLVVLTVLALFVTISLSMFLWVGQSFLGSMFSISFRLR